MFHPVGNRRTSFKSILRCSVATTFLVAVGSLPAHASDGAGGMAGDSTFTSAGGSASTTSTGNSGTDGVGSESSYLSGGAGGGSGLTGGDGGAGSGENAGVGGAGGTLAGEAGTDGSNGGDNSSGGGGGGGAHGYVGLITDLPSSGTLTGGNGGNGGLAGFAGYGGGGGGGGFGAVVTGLNDSYDAITVSATGGAGGAYGWAGVGGNGGSGLVIDQPAGNTAISITDSILTGGAGGGSREGQSFGGNGGSALVLTGGTGSSTVSISGGSITGGDAQGGNFGGAGGFGILIENMSGLTTLTIDTAVTGGAGGAGMFTNGAGGAGIQGENLALSIGTGGSVSGGLGGNGERAAALNFTGGTNRLTLASGATLNGGIVVATSATKLEFAQSENYTLSSAISGSGSVIKTGSGALTLTGDNSAFAGNMMLTGGATVIDGSTTSGNIVFLGGLDGASLTVVNGGTFNAPNIIVSNSTNSAMPGMEDESGSLLVTGTGSTVTTEFLTVGYYGDGSVAIENGGTVVVNTSTSVGAVEGSVGSITVSGENSHLQSGSLQFGGSGQGTLILSGGATLQSTSGSFGVNAGSLGTGTLSGAGTRWDIGASGLGIGTSGEGILTVTDGATIAASGSDADVRLGASANGNGQMTVSGSGSSVTTDRNMTIGSYGSGTATVTDEALLGGDKLIVGFVDGSQGTLNISGEGTLARGTSYVMVGTYAGSSGVVTVSDGATLKSDGNRGITLAYEAGSTGTLNIGAAAGSAAQAAGVIDAANGIQFGAGAGKLVLNHTGTDYVLAAGLSGSGVVDVLAGTTILSGDSSNYSGSLNVDSGLLVLANTTSAASTIIGQDGTLQIGNGGTSGSFDGDLVNNGLLVFDRSDALHHNRVISGTGDLTVAGGVITLSGMNTFTGATTIDAGATLALSNQGRVNQSSSVTVNGTFDLTSAASAQINDLGGSGTVIVGDAGLMLANASQVFSGRITGTGGLNVSAGTLTLTNASDFEGGLGISNGATVNLGNGGTTGSITANVTNYGTLLFDRADDVSYLGQISGQGTVIKTGDNIVTFGGSMSGVQLDVQQGTALFVGTISNNVNVAEQGELVFANPATTSYKGRLSGTGTVLKTGTGTITFSGDSSGFAGDATIDGGTVLLTGKLGGTLLIDTAGTLQVGNGLKNGDLLADATNNGTLIFNQIGDYDYTGALSGNGGLIKQGEGTLLLSGDYGYTGSTVVQAGRVRLLAQLDSATDLVVDDGEFDLSGTDQTVAGLSGAGGTVSLGTSTLTVNQSSNTLFGGSFSGSGTIALNGPSSAPVSINLTGESFGSFTGALNLEGIVTRVNGSMGGTITVGSDAALGGRGQVNNIVVGNGGTLLPGNSIGTLTAAGNVVFQAGSTYEVEVNAEGESDKLIVGGTATIQGGTVSVLAAAGNYRFSNEYTIITAAGGVTGQFAATDVDLPFLTPELSYDANNVRLVLTRNNRSFESVAVTPNQLAVALALDASDDNASLSRAVAGQLEEAGAVRAFDALSGELWATAGTLMVDGTRRLGDMVIGRMEQADVVSRTLAGAGSSARTLRDGSTAVWGQGIGAWSTLKSNGNAIKATQSTFGFITGIDTGLGGWRLGVAFAHEQNKVRVDGRSSEATVNGNSALVYAGGGWGALRARIGASYSWLDVNGTRKVAFLGVNDALAGGYDAKSASAFGEVSYALPLGAVTAEPFAGVTYVHLKSDAFTETGSALTALGVTGNTRDVTYTTLGLRLGGAVPVSATTVLSPRVSAAWLRSFGDVDATSRNILSTGEAFSVAGLPTTRDTLRLEGGVQANIMPGGSIGATYVGNIGDQWKDHGVKIGFSYSF
ncbi:autotransporter domain-containing protein [Sphingobium sp. B12D2B]|uniref:autotransporter domain-containing protein n=1 Tax=Sphingobium sp. B12D2B TaxID=2940577 RepID=UPI002224821D|nr:autotransporter domain-containing protein [Sphingobium sp. B12D2B]MCW2349934.1 outer membrane autotransporter protein [Sphingobium sp. B12D2B]